MKNKILLIVGMLLLGILVGAGGFWGGMTYKANQNSQVQAQFFDQRGGLQTNGQNPGGQFPAGTPFPGGPGGFDVNQRTMRGGTVGQIKSLDGNILKLSTAQNVTTVNLTDETKITKTVAGTLSDLQPGIQIMVVGEQDENGNIIASQITIMNNPISATPTVTAP
jgi:hypothetical protein